MSCSGDTINFIVHLCNDNKRYSILFRGIQIVYCFSLASFLVSTYFSAFWYELTWDVSPRRSAFYPCHRLLLDGLLSANVLAVWLGGDCEAGGWVGGQ